MRIGYARFGRTMVLDPAKWAAVGGDDEPPLLLLELAKRNPQHDFVLIGRNPGDYPQSHGYPPNVINPWIMMQDDWRNAVRDVSDAAATMRRVHEVTGPMIASCDHHIVWAGQHGTSNTPIPMVDDRSTVTNPQASFIRYCGYLVAGYNAWREPDPVNREEIWLHPDPRNYNKARDLKWPPIKSMLAQYTYARDQKHERYDDPRSPADCGIAADWDAPGVWMAKHMYQYSGLELCGVRPEDVEFNDDWDRPGDLGLIVNETRAYVALNRLSVLRDWVLPLKPAFVHGTWTQASQDTLGRCITPVAMSERYRLLHQVRTTFTTPSSGGGWATVKPWQSFAAGVVCFFHPNYDDQGHIIPKRIHPSQPDILNFLSEQLRVNSPADLAARIDLLSEDDGLWRQIVHAQRNYYDWAYGRQTIHRLIEERLI